jgi:hypothetical protein
MKTAIRVGLIAMMALGTTIARADHDPYTENSPHPQAEQGTTTQSSSARSAADEAGARSGAGSMEPRQAIDEDPGTSAHQEWVESIWTSP